MKKIFYLLVMLMTIVGCEQKSSTAELEKIDAPDNACIQCTQKIQAQLAICIRNAGNDQAKIQACNKKASEDWMAQCNAICKPGTEGDKATPMAIEIGQTKQAEKTTKEADKDIKMVASLDGGISVKEACTGSGHVRTIKVNGVCYSQMCCGGEWMFFYKDVAGRRVWCTCNLGESWTVNCDGNNWIVSCR